MTFVLYAQVGGRGTLLHHILTTDNRDWLDANVVDMISAGVTTRVETIRPTQQKRR